MTRVSLKEAYDNKDVVAQIYAIRDIAEGAEDTADSAVTTANTATAHVDALVPQVEGAVQNANNASASAQASAQTVAGYENRLSAVEGDLGDVTLRVTTAEGQIVTIQGRVTALETADGQNVKLTGTQTIGGVKHFANPPTAPTTETGLWDVQVANGQKVKNELDNYAPMVRTANNQSIGGVKTFINGIIALPQGWHATNKSGMTIGQYCIFAKLTGGYGGRYEAIEFFQNSNTASVYGLLIVKSNQDAPLPVWAVRKTNGGNNPLSLTSIAVLSDGTDVFLAWKKESVYGSVSARLVTDMSYGVIQSTSNITWYAESEMTILSDLSGYTVFEVVE